MSDKDDEAGDMGCIVDAAGCSQAKNKPLEARWTFQDVPTLPARTTPVNGQAPALHRHCKSPTIRNLSQPLRQTTLTIESLLESYNRDKTA
jgi:hypothetical protein